MSEKHLDRYVNLRDATTFAGHAEMESIAEGTENDSDTRS